MNKIILVSILTIVLLSTIFTISHADAGKKKIAPFVDPTLDPQFYIDRYNNEPKFKEWFDKTYSEYSSIYQAVGLGEPKAIAPFVDPTKDPQSYVKRYQNEPKYKKWFDKNYGTKYKSIYEAVGLPEPKKPAKKIICEQGAILKDGFCLADKNYKKQLEQIKIKQQPIDILIKKANAYAENKWYDKAQKYYDEALKLDPNNQEAKKNKDKTYNANKSISSTDYNELLSAHRINDAKKACDKVEQHDAYWCKWFVTMELGQYNDAEKYIEKIRSLIEINGNLPPDVRSSFIKDTIQPMEIATLYKQKRYDDLISYLNERIKYSSMMGRDNTYEFMIESLVYEKMNNYERASEIKEAFNGNCYFQMYGIDYTKASYYSSLYDDEKAKFYADKLPDDKFYDQREVEGCSVYGDLIDNRFYTFKLNIEEMYNQQKNRNFG